MLLQYLFSAVVCFFFKQKTAYEMRISDWSSDVCSSDLRMLLCGATAAKICVRVASSATLPRNGATFGAPQRLAAGSVAVPGAKAPGAAPGLGCAIFGGTCRAGA